MKIKIASLVLNNFTNDSRVLKEAKSLINNNYDVTVVGLHEPTLMKQEKIDDLEVRRLSLYTRNLPKLKPIQIIKYFEYIFQTLYYFNSFEIFHCNGIGTLPVAIINKLLFNRSVKIVYDAHEHEAEINELGFFEKRLFKLIESICIKYADATITVSNSIAEDYVKKYCIQKPELVLNCPHRWLASGKNLFREKLRIRRDQKIFLYQGSLSRDRGIELLLEAFASLESDDIILILMGYGQLTDLVKDYAERYKTIFFLPAVPPSELLNYTASADYGIVGAFVDKTCLSYQFSLPNKFFEYLMAGLPVLSSNLVEIKNLISLYNLGTTAINNTTKGIIRAIRELSNKDYSGMASNAVECSKKFCWENQEIVLLKIYRQITQAQNDS